MAQIIQKISIDVSKPNFFQAIVAKQYDNKSRFIKATLIHNKEKVHIEPTSTVVINAIRSDGESNSFAGEVNDDGTATLPLTYWMLELVGTVKCDISVLSGGGRLTTTSFDLEVEKAANNSGDVSENESYDVLLSLIGRVEAVENVETTDNKVTSIDENSTDDQYPSAKAVGDAVALLQYNIDNRVLYLDNKITDVAGDVNELTGALTQLRTDTDDAIALLRDRTENQVLNLDNKITDVAGDVNELEKGFATIYRDVDNVTTSHNELYTELETALGVIPGEFEYLDFETIKDKFYSADPADYEDGDGKISHSGARCSELIQVQDGQTYFVSGMYGTDCCLIAEFDYEQNFIRGVCVSDTGYNATAQDYEYTVPVGVHYVAFSTKMWDVAQLTVTTSAKQQFRYIGNEVDALNREVGDLLTSVNRLEEKVDNIELPENWEGDVGANAGITQLEEKVADALGRDTYYRDITETFTLKAGTYYVTNGTYKSMATAQCTDIFPVKQGEKYKVTGSYTGTYCLIALYDENKTFIKSIGRADLGGYDATFEYVVPETELDINGVEKKVAFMACTSVEANRISLNIQLEINGFNRPKEFIDDLSNENKILFDTVYKGQSIKQYVVQDGSFNDDGSEKIANNRKRTDFIRIYGSNIRIVIPDGLQVYIWEFDDDKNFVKYSGWHKGTVEYEASNPYIRLSIKNDAGNSTITPEQVQEIVIADCNPVFDSIYTASNFSFFVTNDKKATVRATNTAYSDGAYLDVEAGCSFVFCSSITSKVTTSKEELAIQLNEGLAEGQEIFTVTDEKYTLALKSDQSFVFDVVEERYKVVNSADLSNNHAIILSVYNGVVCGLVMNISNFNEIQDLKNLHPLLTDVENQACKTFAELFVSTTGRTESLLFFTDPHLSNRTDTKPEFDYTLDKIKAVYDNTPVSTCVCGGDWLVNGNTKENAAWVLGKIDGAMKSRFGKYINILGNHDTNYQGYEYTQSGNDRTQSVNCILSNSTLTNLWHRQYGKNYFATDGDCTKFYVFDTGSDWEVSMNDYRWEQVDWFANSLLNDKPERCAILLHIGSKDYAATPFVDNLTMVAKAFNDNASLTLNDKTYDFTDSTGHLYFTLAGHGHVDMHFVQNDIPVVFTANMFFDNYIASDVPNYDLVLADYDTNKLYLVRVGLEHSHEGTDDFDENGIRTFDMA